MTALTPEQTAFIKNDVESIIKKSRFCIIDMSFRKWIQCLQYKSPNFEEWCNHVYFVFPPEIWGLPATDTPELCTMINEKSMKRYPGCKYTEVLGAYLGAIQDMVSPLSVSDFDNKISASREFHKLAVQYTRDADIKRQEIDLIEGNIAGLKREIERNNYNLKRAKVDIEYYEQSAKTFKSARDARWQ